jgi:hypothetical protein
VQTFRGVPFMWNRIADLWCRKMHTEAMWPIHGRYVCKRCLREHTVDWSGLPNRAEYGNLPMENGRVGIDSAVWVNQR